MQYLRALFYSFYFLILLLFLASLCACMRACVCSDERTFSPSVLPARETEDQDQQIGAGLAPNCNPSVDPTAAARAEAAVGDGTPTAEDLYSLVFPVRMATG